MLRWELYNLIRDVVNHDQTDKLFNFLMQRFDLSFDQRHEARRCAARFVSLFKIKWQNCCRKKALFEKRFKSWLDEKACVPQKRIILPGT